MTAVLVIGGCSSPKQDGAGAPVPQSARATRPETVTVRDVDLERRAARLELRLMEKEAQVEELETRLSDARDEVVATMAKLRNIASRAEAASAMAEADVALQQLRGLDGARALPEMAQATRYVQQSTAEFNKENYGGALYLANQVKSASAAARARLAVANRGPVRPGETPFAVPVRVRMAGRGNVREGPGTSFNVVFEGTAGTALTALSHMEDWVRVVDDSGRSGWIFRSLIERR